MIIIIIQALCITGMICGAMSFFTEGHNINALGVVGWATCALVLSFSQGEIPVNYSKLNELAAKAMGFSDKGPFLIIPWGQSTPMPRVWARPSDGQAWNPSTCADDALQLLSKTAQDTGWTLYYFENTKDYRVYLNHPVSYQEHYKTAPLAMTVEGLRAAGIPESEITAAME